MADKKPYWPPEHIVLDRTVYGRATLNDKQTQIIVTGYAITVPTEHADLIWASLKAKGAVDWKPEHV